jgi:hypothetical protein
MMDNTIETPNREITRMALPFRKLAAVLSNEISPSPSINAPTRGNTGTSQAY